MGFNFKHVEFSDSASYDAASTLSHRRQPSVPCMGAQRHAPRNNGPTSKSASIPVRQALLDAVLREDHDRSDPRRRERVVQITTTGQQPRRTGRLTAAPIAPNWAVMADLYSAQIVGESLKPVIRSQRRPTAGAFAACAPCSTWPLQAP